MILKYIMIFIIVSFVSCKNNDMKKSHEISDVINYFKDNDTLAMLSKKKVKIDYQCDSNLKYIYALFYTENLIEVLSYKFVSLNHHQINIDIYKYSENITSDVNKLISNPSLLLKGCYIIIKGKENLVKIEYVNCKSKLDLNNLEKMLSDLVKDNFEEVILCDFGGPCIKSSYRTNFIHDKANSQ